MFLIRRRSREEICSRHLHRFTDVFRCSWNRCLICRSGCLMRRVFCECHSNDTRNDRTLMNEGDHCLTENSTWTFFCVRMKPPKVSTSFSQQFISICLLLPLVRMSEQISISVIVLLMNDHYNHFFRNLFSASERNICKWILFVASFTVIQITLFDSPRVLPVASHKNHGGTVVVSMNNRYDEFHGIFRLKV